jgi:hypothetical protein
MKQVLRFILSVTALHIAVTASALNHNFPEEVLMDTIPPVIQCPASATITLGHFQCDTVLNFTVTATDNAGPVNLTQTSGLASGTAFPIGINSCTFLATDLAGNTASCSFSFTVTESANTNLTCKSNFDVHLDGNCSATILPEDFLENGPYGCPSRYAVRVDKTPPLGNGAWVPAVFGPFDIDRNYLVRVTDTQTNISCWGNVTIVDETGPVLQCENITISCAETSSSPAFLRDSLGFATAFPMASDACGDVTDIVYFDNDSPFNCAEDGTISRTWQATDEYGNTSTCLQLIQKHRHTMDELLIPADLTISCPNNDPGTAITGQPYVLFQGRRYDLINGLICDLSAFYQDFPLPLPCGNVQIQRVWEKYDFCSAAGTGPFIQNIYLTDQSGPVIDCPPSVVVSVNSDSCRGMVDLPDLLLNDLCSQITSFGATWVDEGVNKTLTGSLGDFIGNDLSSFDTLGIMGLASLPMGSTMVTYVATDSCGNVSDCIFELFVSNTVPPVAVCDSFSTVMLLETGTLALPASSFDLGSTDDCTDPFFKVKWVENTACLYDTVWSDTLRFCCLNLHDTLDAVLRVYDIPTPIGVVADNFGMGNFTDCTFRILVEDQNPLSCVAAQPVTVDCDEFDPSLQSYGGIVDLSCGVDSTVTAMDYSQFDSLCKVGSLVRIFTVFDDAGNTASCSQTVTVNYKQNYFVRFPDDVIVTLCDSSGIYGEPSFFGQNCEFFDVTFTDEVFTVVPDACLKIERTWRVTNLCTYDSNLPLVLIPNPNPNAINNHPDNLSGPTVSACDALSPWEATNVKINPTDPSATNYCVFWSDIANGYRYKQIIKIIDGIAPKGTFVQPTCSNQNWTGVNNPEFWHESYWYDAQRDTNDLTESPTEITTTGTDECAGSEIQIDYLLFLDLDANGIAETVINSRDIGANGLGWNNVRYENLNTPNFLGGSPRAFDKRPVPANEKMGFAKQEIVSGRSKTARVTWNTEQNPNTHFPPLLPLGEHYIKWFITDQCGNNAEYQYDFNVRDCMAPTLVCKDTQVVQLQTDATVSVETSDLLQSVEDTYTPSNDIPLGVRKCGTGSGFPFNILTNSIITSETFYCDDLGSQCVELWAIDQSGNTTFCTTTVIIEDSLGACQVLEGNTGRIFTELGEGVEAALITLDDGGPIMPPGGPVGLLTDSVGLYKITGLPFLPSNYSILPVKDDNPLNGVTTFDLVLISKHILGSEPLNSPYKMIAADANKSGSITTFDIVEFRKLILGIYTALPNNKSWRFVDSSFSFPNPLNPFQTAFPEKIPLSNGLPYNFIGIKVGDVNYTSMPNAQASVSERFEGRVYMDTEDRLVQEGEIFELEFKAAEPLEGCQFSLEMDGLELLELKPGTDMAKEHFAHFPDQSMLNIAWEAGGLASYSLRLKAEKVGLLRDMLRIGDDIASAEAYQTVTSGGTLLRKKELALRFGNPNTTFDLFQNQPNPFAHKTTLSFQLPEVSNATLTVFDGTGRIIWSKSAEYPAGLNTVQLDLAPYNAMGVLYYKLETPAHSAVRKMVRL